MGNGTLAAAFVCPVLRNVVPDLRGDDDFVAARSETPLAINSSLKPLP